MNGHPRYQGLRLDGPVEQFHRAVARLRADTVPAPLDHQPAAHRRRPVAATRTRVTGREPCLRRHREHQPAPD
jgi:hypothetical protein